MSEIRFYHLERASLEQVLPELLNMLYGRGMRVAVKAGSEERLRQLNGLLWTFDPASFLPHGSAEEGFAEQQPIWLCTDDGIPNGAEVLVLTDGTDSPHVGEVANVCLMFDGRDVQAVTSARARWKSYADAGHFLTYWKQSTHGGWSKEASVNAPASGDSAAS